MGICHARENHINEIIISHQPSNQSNLRNKQNYQAKPTDEEIEFQKRLRQEKFFTKNIAGSGNAALVSKTLPKVNIAVDGIPIVNMNSAQKDDYTSTGRCLPVPSQGIKCNSHFRKNFFPYTALCVWHDSWFNNLGWILLEDGDIIYNEGLSHFGVSKKGKDGKTLFYNIRLLGIL